MHSVHILRWRCRVNIWTKKQNNLCCTDRWSKIVPCFQIKNNLDHLKRILIPFHLPSYDFSPSSMFRHSDYLLSYQEQTNDEKRIKRYLHHKLHPSPNACLSFLPPWKAFNLFPSCSGTDSRGQGAQEMKLAPVNILVPVGPYLSNILMMKMSEQQVEVDDI